MLDNFPTFSFLAKFLAVPLKFCSKFTATQNKATEDNFTYQKFKTGFSQCSFTEKKFLVTMVFCILSGSVDPVYFTKDQLCLLSKSFI